MTLPDFLSSDAYGEIFLAGHRITLYHLIRSYLAGLSAECLAAEFPTLPRALIEKVIAFYLANKPEADRYLKETQAEIDSQAEAAPAGPTVTDLRRRLAARQQSESA
jgi:uncharacterized protein (DUF433 family)